MVAVRGLERQKISSVKGLSELAISPIGIAAQRGEEATQSHTGVRGKSGSKKLTFTDQSSFYHAALH